MTPVIVMKIVFLMQYSHLRKNEELSW